MSNSFKQMLILYGQSTSAVILIVFLWIWGDSDSGQKFFSEFELSPILCKSVLSFLILIIFGAVFFRSLSNYIKSTKENGNE